MATTEGIMYQDGLRTRLSNLLNEDAINRSEFERRLREVAYDCAISFDLLLRFTEGERIYPAVQTRLADYLNKREQEEEALSQQEEREKEWQVLRERLWTCKLTISQLATATGIDVDLLSEFFGGNRGLTEEEGQKLYDYFSSPEGQRASETGVTEAEEESKNTARDNDLRARVSRLLSGKAAGQSQRSSETGATGVKLTNAELRELTINLIDASTTLTIRDVAKGADVGYITLRDFLSGEGELLPPAKRRLTKYLERNDKTMSASLTGDDDGADLFNSASIMALLNEVPENNCEILKAHERISTVVKWAEESLGIRVEVKGGQWRMWFPEVDDKKEAFRSASMRDLVLILIAIYMSRRKEGGGELDDTLEELTINPRNLNI